MGDNKPGASVRVYIWACHIMAGFWSGLYLAAIIARIALPDLEPAPMGYLFIGSGWSMLGVLIAAFGGRR